MGEEGMERHIVVCIKAVMVKAPSGRDVRSSDNCVVNPFDRVAMEAALQLKESSRARLTALSMGPESTSFVLSEALAMGFDRTVLISDPALAGSDTLATARVLAAALRTLAPVDLAMFGTRSADSDTGQVGPQVAVLLDLPLVSGVRVFRPESNALHLERICDGFRESFRLDFPGVVTVHPACARPRDLGLAGLETAFGRRPPEIRGLADLGLAPELAGEAGSPTRLCGLSRVDGTRRCEFLDGGSREQAEELVQRLAAKGLIS